MNFLRSSRFFTLLLLVFACPSVPGQSSVSKVWVADNGDGTYKNPVLFADYSDPDVIRVGEDFYLVSSSFNSAPGLPVLHSKDLVNWSIIGHVFGRQAPPEVFSKPQHGNGVWAPAIRFHKGEFFIFYPDPDLGIYMVKAKDPAGPWSEPLLIKAAKGWIDPCPFWDEDGQAYLVSAFARSRAGIKSILIISRMSEDGTRLLDDGVLVFDGHEGNPTIEGPKLYKRNGYYYIFAPAGGVEGGWQLALRAKEIFGPYESRIVLAQGKTAINGPHQGAWIETTNGESWFMHFQDRGPFGRVVHLQPMKWVDDWPVIGSNGQPVLKFRKPNAGKSYPVATPADSDEFNASSLGLQWQWQANPQTNWALTSAAYGVLRLFTVPPPAPAKNFWDVPNLLLQKFPAPTFTASTKVTFMARSENDRVGLVVMGLDYGYLAATKRADGLYLSQTLCKDADKGSAEQKGPAVPIKANTFYLRVKVTESGSCSFSYSLDGKSYVAIGAAFRARQGRWIGAKVGLFATGAANSPEMGNADFDWFRVE
jgi:beta-xylosidase